MLIGDVLALTDLTEKHDAPVDGLSRGMKQRLGLARSVSETNTVILNGVSPRAQAGRNAVKNR